MSFGLPEDHAKMMSTLDIAVKHGAEERSSDAVLALTGKMPKKFRELAEELKSAWL